LREVLDAAERAHVAVGHFNFSDLVTLKAVVTSAHELRVPVMVGVSEGERAFLGVRQAAAAVRTFREELALPIFLPTPQGAAQASCFDKRHHRGATPWASGTHDAITSADATSWR